MEHVSQGATAIVGSFIGALELEVDPVTIRHPNDADIESMSVAPAGPTHYLPACPTMACNYTKAAGCRFG